PAAPATEAATDRTPAERRLGDLLARLVREADARTPAERRTRRTLQEMTPGYERQPVLVLYRPVMANDACPLCGRWNCDPNTCPPAATAPAPATAGTGMQCAQCGGWFGVTAAPAGPATSWVCSACQAIG
ncbi:hypothetical protein NGM37_44175, partial [Streptomyces sp. TRM76130]|nr:hypothetical protein [Streptomyces sp. TRM76130]